MRLMVTGGAGYIGSHVVLDLLQAGHQVVVVDNLSSGHVEAVRRVQELARRRCELVVADIADSARLGPALAGVDAVVHLAAFTSVPESMERPDHYFRNNVGGMAALLHTMEAAAVRRIVFASSAAVYGVQQELLVGEDLPLRPENPYGASKAQGERMLDWMARCLGWSAVSLRTFNPVGAHPSGRIGQPYAASTAGLVPRALQALSTPGARLTVCGSDYPTPDGTCLRDYIHISDLARAHRLALAALERPGHQVFNVGTGRPRSVREVLATCACTTGQQVPSVDGPRRPGDIAVAVADPRRIRASLGFSPALGLEDMVDSAWRWWRDNPGGYQAEAGD